MTARTAPVRARSDDELLRDARAGGAAAFDELWERHRASAGRVAWQFARDADADALVARVHDALRTRILAGGGPSGAFRPYLYAAVRDAAQVAAPAEEPSGSADPDELERILTVRAYRSLPERWQTVLWYVEVEGLEPSVVAPILGLTAPAVETLAERARAGLRAAWLRQHVIQASDSADCRWTISRLDSGSAELTVSERRRLDAHLDGCARCTVLADRIASGGPILKAAVIPVVVGSVAGAALLTQLSVAGAAHAATAAGVAGTGVAAGTVVSGAAAAGVTGAAATGAVTGAAATGAAATGLAAGAASGAAVAAGAGAGATAGGVSTIVTGLAAAALVGGSVALGPSAATTPPVTPPTAAVSSATAVPASAVTSSGVGSGSTAVRGTSIAGPATPSAGGVSSPVAPADPSGPSGHDLTLVAGLLAKPAHDAKGGGARAHAITPGDAGSTAGPAAPGTPVTAGAPVTALPPSVPRASAPVAAPAPVSAPLPASAPSPAPASAPARPGRGPGDDRGRGGPAGSGRPPGLDGPGRGRGGPGRP